MKNYRVVATTTTDTQRSFQRNVANAIKTALDRKNMPKTTHKVVKSGKKYRVRTQSEKATPKMYAYSDAALIKKMVEKKRIPDTKVSLRKVR